MSKNQDKTKVTRIKASDAASDKTATKTKPARPKATKAQAVKSTAPRKKRSYGVLGQIGGYFKGAWLELRQVHWPTRRSTWGLTLAVLLFSGFFVAFIMLLDAGFKYAFEQILK